MDDWLTILLAFVFFVLPLLEGIFKKSRRGGPTPGPHPGPAPSEDFEDADFEMERLELESADPPGGEQWSGGWGSWPSDEPEEVEEKEEPVRVWGSELGRAPVVERHEDVTYSTDDKPLQELAERLNRIAISEPEPVASTFAEPPALPGPDAAVLRSEGPPRSTRRDGVRVARLLRDRRGVREAIVLTEVLGPPLASRY